MLRSPSADYDVEARFEADQAMVVRILEEIWVAVIADAPRGAR